MLFGYLTLLALTAVWGLTFPMVQNALRDATPTAFVAARFALAALLFPLMAWPRVFRITRSMAFQGLWLGFLVWGGYTLQTYGLTCTTAARSGFLTGTLVPMTPLFSWLLFRDRISLRIWLAALLAFAGTFAMSRPDAGGLNLGDVLTLFCAACYALQIVFVSRWVKSSNEVQLVWLQLVVTAVLAFLFFPVQAQRFELTSQLAIALAVTAIFGSALGLWAQLRYQPLISATAAAIIYACEPIFAGLAAWWIQAEEPPQATLIGAALIVCGMLLSSLRTQTKPAIT